MLIILIVVFFSLQSVAQTPNTVPYDSLRTTLDSTKTSTLLQPDSLKSDTLLIDSSRVKISANAIKSDVKYSANDSISFDLKTKTVKMYNNAQVNYEQIELKSAHISYGFGDNLVYATSLPDTAGKPYGKPSFKEADQSYDSDTLRYNFKTKKGAIKGVYTKLNNDGHLYGELVKKDTNNVLFVKNGEFCPCEDKDAITRIHIKKIKVIPGSKIVTGAGYLSIGKIPTPLAFPFGFFPNQDKQSSGILVPSYGDSPNLGFFLINGGYYQPLSDKVDLQLTGDIYSKGSYGFNGVSRYKSMYKNAGDLSIKYNVVKNSYKEFIDYSESRNFFVRWNHTQDPKSKPNTSFSANVNVGSGSTFRNNFNSSVTDYVSNSFNSGINYGKSWDGKPYTVSISANHSQNTQTRAFSVTLPNAAFNVQRIYLPLSFLKADSNPKSMWYEKIGLTYNTSFRNQLNTTEPELRFDNTQQLLTDFKKGMNHGATMSTSLKAFHFTINPSINYNENWYFDRIQHFYEEKTGIRTEAREYGFYRTNDYNFNLNFTTQLFGMYAAKRGKIAAIRHMLTPSASVFYRPKFNNLTTSNTGINGSQEIYNPYGDAIFGAPNNLESGGLNLSLNNNLEMKVRTPSDSAQQFKKIKLIEAYSLSSSYDVFRDSVKWSDINMQARTVLFQKLNIQYTGIFSPYSYDPITGFSTNASLLKEQGKLIRMKTTQLALGFSFGKIADQQAGKRKKGEKLALRHILPSGIPISANINYNLNFQRGYGQANDTLITTQSLNASGEIQLLRKIKVGYTSGYDFTLKDFTPTFLNIYVDLNCWELVAGYVPFGNRKSYTVRLNMKSAILKDVKLERKRNLSENNLIF